MHAILTILTIFVLLKHKIYVNQYLLEYFSLYNVINQNSTYLVWIIVSCIFSRFILFYFEKKLWNNELYWI